MSTFSTGLLNESLMLVLLFLSVFLFLYYYFFLRTFNEILYTELLFLKNYNGLTERAGIDTATTVHLMVRICLYVIKSFFPHISKVIRVSCNVETRLP